MLSGGVPKSRRWDYNQGKPDFLETFNRANRRMSNPEAKVTVRTIQQKKRHGERISMLTAYDFPTAQMLDEAGIDMLLVGDSLGMVVQGHTNTIGVTVWQMIYHAEMVARATKHAMVVVDLPFPVGQLSVHHTVATAAKIMKKTGCEAVKLEGGAEQADAIRSLVDAGIPTVAHVGLRPQSVHALGGYRVQRDADKLKRDAMAAQEAGAFCVLMECVPAELAERLTQELRVPTIGIGAGSHCDGQVLVTNDLLGWNSGYLPKFVRKYGDLRLAAKAAVQQYREDVEQGRFPGNDETFH